MGPLPETVKSAAVLVPEIAPEVFALRPDFRAVSLCADAVVNDESHPTTTRALQEACAAPCTAHWAQAHREAWADAYRGFGAKPQRTPCSAEALLKRVQRDGTLPAINAVVDLYNAVSLRYALPVGGENAAAYQGVPKLLRAKGDEPFHTVQGGTAMLEHPDAGEVIWCDDAGVTCRRWNWRQGTRTRIEADTTSMWFILEALSPLPEEYLTEAGRELAEGLRNLSPDCRLAACLISREGTQTIKM